MGIGWTGDQIATLAALADEGRSASQIALDLGTSRNSVIGKARRHGIALKGNAGRTPGAEREKGTILSGVRKAYKSKGDDATLTRFVKTGLRRRAYQPLLIESARAVAPRLQQRQAALEGRTLFKRSVKNLAQIGNLLVSGHSNVKIGRDVRAPAKLFRGYWIYVLSFEERATCPRSCHHWETCYGNHMPYAKRVDHRDIAGLTTRLEGELQHLLAIKPCRGVVKRQGVLVRLHALGDFFSVEYVRFWAAMLALHGKLACYGYTAHAPNSEIGAEIARLKALHGPRFAVRWSNGGLDSDCTVPVQAGTGKVENAFICPEQMNLCDANGRAIVCATCGLCWSTSKNVAFMEH